MSPSRADRMKENFSLQGGRPQRRHIPEPQEESFPTSGPGKRAEELVISLPVDQLLPDRYQGRLRWPVDLKEIERLYRGEWDAQDFLDHIASRRQEEENPALDLAWEATVELARSILTEGQVAPITIARARDLPVGYQYVIETGEGRYWAYQLMRWLLTHDPESLDVPAEEWREDPGFIRAMAISEPSKLRQVAENEQRQSYASAIDRAVAYASMLAEEADYAIEGSPPGIRDGLLELPEAYWRAARRGLRGRKAVLQQVPAGARQIQRHLKLLTDLDPWVLARAKQYGLSEAQLRPLVGKAVEEQRQMVEKAVSEGLSSRAIEAEIRGGIEEEAGVILQEEEVYLGKEAKRELTLPEEVSRFLRSLTTAAARYEALLDKINENQVLALLEAELRSYDEAARGAQRARTPRRRVRHLLTLLGKINE
ncbi:MAG: ParB N-terminal domain-containing protein [Ardenticatenales bacterium]|nr:ParB N-terminal domain-containing protein [Ardenticatenales bacterium]